MQGAPPAVGDPSDVRRHLDAHHDRHRRTSGRHLSRPCVGPRTSGAPPPGPDHAHPGRPGCPAHPATPDAGGRRPNGVPDENPRRKGGIHDGRDHRGAPRGRPDIDRPREGRRGTRHARDGRRGTHHARDGRRGTVNLVAGHRRGEIPSDDLHRSGRRHGSGRVRPACLLGCRPRRSRLDATARCDHPTDPGVVLTRPGRPFRRTHDRADRHGNGGRRARTGHRGPNCRHERGARHRGNARPGRSHRGRDVRHHGPRTRDRRSTVPGHRGRIRLTDRVRWSPRGGSKNRPCPLSSRT